MTSEADVQNAFLVEALLDFLRRMYPDAWFMIVPDGTRQLKVPMMTKYNPFAREPEKPDLQMEYIQIRQSRAVPSLWWGYGQKTNRLAYWVEET